MLKTSLVACATVLALAACSSAPSNTNAAKDDATARAVAPTTDTVGAQTVTQVSFAKGSDSLTADSRRALAEALTRARARGELEQVKVIAWADQEFPSVQGKKLSRAQQNLAGKRVNSISEMIKKETTGVDVDTFNMAQRPNAIERLFRTEDFRVKRSLEQAGIPNMDSAVKAPAMRGKALVMFVVENDSASN